MRSRIFVLLLAVGALACGLYVVSAQPGDDEVRGAFLSSRPKTTNNNAPSRRHRPRHTNSNTNASSGAATNANANTAATNTNTAHNKNSSKNEARSEEHTSELQSYHE